MQDDELIQEIISGTVEGESPADVLYLCTSMATARFSHYLEEFHSYGSAGSFQHARVFERILRSSSEILCPVFMVVKPAEFVAGMIEMRRKYRGVASDPDLQAKFGLRVKALIEEGQLQSLEQAIKDEIWERLKPLES